MIQFKDLNLKNVIYYWSLFNGYGKHNINITAMYNKDVIGFVNLNRRNSKDYEVVMLGAIKGMGHKMYEAAMTIIYPDYLIPYRSALINPVLYSTYIKFINRSDIESEPILEDDPDYVEISLTKENHWFNRRYKAKELFNINTVFDKTRRFKSRGHAFFLSIYDNNMEDNLNPDEYIK